MDSVNDINERIMNGFRATRGYDTIKIVHFDERILVTLNDRELWIMDLSSDDNYFSFHRFDDHITLPYDL